MPSLEGITRKVPRIILTMENHKEPGMQKCLIISSSIKQNMGQNQQMSKANSIWLVFGWESEVYFNAAEKSETFLQLCQARQVCCSLATRTRTSKNRHVKVKKDLAVVQPSRSVAKGTSGGAFARRGWGGPSVERVVQGSLRIWRNCRKGRREKRSSG